MSQTPEEETEFDYEGDYANAARQLNRLVRSGRSYSGHERNRCFLNVHGRRFANVSMISGFDFPEDGRAIAVCDWDADGRQDFWVANRTAPQIRFMRNQVSSADQHYVAFRLAGTRSNRDGIGARVRVELERDGTTSSLVRSLRAGEGFLSCSSKSLHFGLGSATSVRLVEVRWPTGSVESFGGIHEVDGIFDLVEGAGRIERRDSTATNIADTSPPPRSALPDQSFETHNLLTERIALPPLTYVSLDDSIADASKAAGHPVLINLWATWCQPCLKELSEWSQRNEELRRIGVEVIALSVDQVSGDQSSSQQDSSVDIAGYLKRLGFKQTAGKATTQALDALQHVHNTIYDHHRPLPVPTSFLLDGRGRLSAVYKGPVSVDRILQDVQALALEGTALAESGLPFGGRWLGPLRLHNASQIVEDLWQDGYEDEAIEYVHRLNPSRYSPHVTRSRLFLAQQYEARDQHREAAALLNETLRDEPNNPVAHERLGILLARQGDAGAALAHLQRATLEFDPPRADAHFNLGRLLRKTGDVERAAVELSRAVAIRPRFGAAHEQLGLLFASQGRMEPAVSHFRAALEKIPDDLHLRVNVAMALHRLGRDEEAWSDLETVVQRKDAPPMTLLLAVEILEQLQRSSEAIEYVRRFLGQDENAADVRLRLAGLLEQQGNQGEALQQYRRILNSDGNNVSVLTRVAWLLATSPDDTIRDGNAALQFAQQAIQANGRPLSSLLDVLAAAQAEVGRYDDAILTVRNAMKLAADSGESRNMNGLRERAELYRQRKHYRSKQVTNE